MSNMFSILDIWADGYERVAQIRLVNSEAGFLVGFIEHTEYIDLGKSTKRAAGSLIEGNLKIDCVSNFLCSDRELFYAQIIPQSPFIQAVVEVIEIIDDFSVKAHLYGYTAPVTVEFESRIPETLSGKILINGELQIDICS